MRIRYSPAGQGPGGAEGICANGNLIGVIERSAAIPGLIVAAVNRVGPDNRTGIADLQILHEKVGVGRGAGAVRREAGFDKLFAGTVPTVIPVSIHIYPAHDSGRAERGKEIRTSGMSRSVIQPPLIGGIGI